MVAGNSVDPGTEVVNPVFMQFRNGFEKNLLHAVFSLLLIFQVFHANAEEQEDIALEYRKFTMVNVTFRYAVRLLLRTGQPTAGRTFPQDRNGKPAGFW
jgi:hypothetical protein